MRRDTIQQADSTTVALPELCPEYDAASRF